MLVYPYTNLIMIQLYITSTRQLQWPIVVFLVILFLSSSPFYWFSSPGLQHRINKPFSLIWSIFFSELLSWLDPFNSFSSTLHKAVRHRSLKVIPLLPNSSSTLKFWINFLMLLLSSHPSSNSPPRSIQSMLAHWQIKIFPFIWD